VMLEVLFAEVDEVLSEVMLWSPKGPSSDFHETVMRTDGIGSVYRIVRKFCTLLLLLLLLLAGVDGIGSVCRIVRNSVRCCCCCWLAGVDGIGNVYRIVRNSVRCCCCCWLAGVDGIGSVRNLYTGGVCTELLVCL
jgi:hypothetical protein